MGQLIDYQEQLLALSLLGDNMTDKQRKQAKKLIEWMEVHNEIEDNWGLE